MAWNDMIWILEGAAVRVSVVGFDIGTETSRFLNGKSVTTINSDLSGQIDLTQASQHHEIANLTFQGPVKVGSFDNENSLAREMLREENPMAFSNVDVIKPWMRSISQNAPASDLKVANK